MNSLSLTTERSEHRHVLLVLFKEYTLDVKECYYQNDKTKYYFQGIFSIYFQLILYLPFQSVLSLLTPYVLTI